jgi:hypothetical protein
MSRCVACPFTAAGQELELSHAQVGLLVWRWSTAPISVFITTTWQFIKCELTFVFFNAGARVWEADHSRASTCFKQRPICWDIFRRWSQQPHGSEVSGVCPSYFLRRDAADVPPAFNASSILAPPG